MSNCIFPLVLSEDHRCGFRTRKAGARMSLAGRVRQGQARWMGANSYWKGKRHMAQLPKDQHITYQLQYRKCGKSSCKTCREGKGHGPYWYAYWREGSRLRSGYVGKTPPNTITASTDTSTDASISSQNGGTMPVSNEEDDTCRAQRATA